MVTYEKNKRKKAKFTIDTNVLQSLFVLQHGTAFDIIKLRRQYNDSVIDGLKFLIDNIDEIEFYVTAHIALEIAQCDKKHPGIIEYMKKNCKLKKVKESDEEYIAGLKEKYLEEDILLPDATRQLQSAISTEIKDHETSDADANIVAENNICNGNPFITLNEKHFIIINQAQKSNYPYRSKAILQKNKEFLDENPRVPKETKANLKKETATTFRSRRHDLESLM